VEVYGPPGIDWPQPFGKPVDLTAPDEEIMRIDLDRERKLF
jgi:hypothetical protein